VLQCHVIHILYTNHTQLIPNYQIVSLAPTTAQSV
jgi:hypothetical protein